MFRAGGAVVGAAMMLWCGAASAATVINDPAGDANGLGNAGQDLATAPASDAARDLTKVTITPEKDALSVAFTTSAPLTPGQAPSELRLHLTTPKCPVNLIVAIAGANEDASRPRT